MVNKLIASNFRRRPASLRSGTAIIQLEHLGLLNLIVGALIGNRN